MEKNGKSSSGQGSFSAIQLGRQSISSKVLGIKWNIIQNREQEIMSRDMNVCHLQEIYLTNTGKN